MSQHETTTPYTPGVIRVEGVDAASFLRAQLSNDVFRLGTDRHFLAAWCDAKGRTQLVLRVVAISNAFLLIMPRTLIQPALQRLRMYVLRSKVTLTDVSANMHLAGLIGDDDGPAVNETRSHGTALHLGLPAADDDRKRTLVVETEASETPPGGLPPDAPEWQLAGVDAGVPEITSAVQGAFVPQMLNLHWLLAIDFDKGCYPGQEVIARLHYRGRLTRRLFRLAFSGDIPAPGTSITTAAGEDAGTVIQAAAAGEEKRLLAVVRIEKVTGALQLEDGSSLALLELPYATPD